MLMKTKAYKNLFDQLGIDFHSVAFPFCSHGEFHRIECLETSTSRIIFVSMLPAYENKICNVVALIGNQKLNL